MSASEVARIREQIDLEIAASRRGCTGYAVVSRHDIITNHYGRLSDYMEELRGHIGTQAALELVIEALDRQP